MSIEINISDNIQDLKFALKILKEKEVLNATRRSLNRTVVHLRKRSTKIVKTKYHGLKSTEIKKEFMRMRKARGNRLQGMSAALSFSDRPVEMIRMVVGSKTPRAQKGKAVDKRTPIRVQIQRGKKFILKKAFIARASKGRFPYQVFKRNKKTNKLIQQSIPSVGKMMDKKKLLINLRKQGEKFFQKTFAHEFKFRMERMAKRARRIA